MEVIYNCVINYILGILSSLTASILQQEGNIFARVLSRRFPFIRRKIYFKILYKQIKSMPFIYKGIDLEVINNFVDVEVKPIDVTNLKITKQNNKTNDNVDEKLRASDKIIFLGNAGIGKTTLQRYAILLLILKSPHKRFVFKGEKLFPIYVPLKLVDNSRQFPIVRYIINNNVLFRSANESKSLIRFANFLQKEKVFFFLDGYDEITFVNELNNHIQEELSFFFLPDYSIRTDIMEYLKKFTYNHQLIMNFSSHNNFVEIYRNINGCRFWLSSRKEFFINNPLKYIGEGEVYEKKGLKVLLVKGIGDNRFKLVKNIFGKYIKKENSFKELLNEEYFLNKINHFSDKTLKELSYNPLFLTIMCYVYIQRVKKEKSYDVKWSSTIHKLIISCIELLINDLDEEKARELPAAHRAGLLGRRNAFVNEKIEFLKYFASKLVLENIATFTIDIINEHVRLYFESISTSENAKIILNYDEDDTFKTPSFTRQLIYSGLFTFFDFQKDTIQYDFPHRRFREILATEYLLNPDGYIELLSIVKTHNISELLALYTVKREFQSNLFQKKTISTIFEKISYNPQGSNFDDITKYFMRFKPETFDHSVFFN